MALLRKSRLRHDGPFPRWFQTMRTISAVPRALKRLMRAMRIWISAVWLSCSDALAEGLEIEPVQRHRFKRTGEGIFASIRLRAWYPVQRFQNVLP